MSHDLVAVQRDAALLDSLAERGLVQDGDRVAGLLAALAAEVDAAEVDENLIDVVGPQAPPLIPEQGGRRARPGTVSPLPLPLPPTGQRHVARAVAAMIVAAAVLSVSGVAAAVSGDPLTPYKRVIDVVRVGYDEIVPKGLAAPKPAIVTPPVSAAAPKAATAVEQVRNVAGPRASGAADSRRLWGHHVGNRSGWSQSVGDQAGSSPAGSDRARWGRGSSRSDRDSRHWNGRQGDRSAGGGTNGSAANANGQHRSAPGGGSRTSNDRRDSGEQGDQSGYSRR
jgi:hypothetical protein